MLEKHQPQRAAYKPQSWSLQLPTGRAAAPKVSYLSGVSPAINHVLPLAVRSPLDYGTSISVHWPPLILAHSRGAGAAPRAAQVPRRPRRPGVMDGAIFQASSGGLVMVNFYSEFIGCGPNATLMNVIGGPVFWGPG